MQIQAPDMHAMHEHHHCEKNIKAKAEPCKPGSIAPSPLLTSPLTFFFSLLTSNKTWKKCKKKSPSTFGVPSTGSFLLIAWAIGHGTLWPFLRLFFLHCFLPGKKVCKEHEMKREGHLWWKVWSEKREYIAFLLPSYWLSIHHPFPSARKGGYLTRYTEGKENKREVRNVYISGSANWREEWGLEPNLTRGTLSIAIVLYTHPHAIRSSKPDLQKKLKNSIGYLVCLVWEVDLVEYLDGLVLYGLHLHLVGRVLPLTGPAIAT